MDDVRGKVAVVTGGGSGIGRGLALAFAEAGMRVVVADIEPDAAQAVAEEVGGRAVPTDVSSVESVQALADRTFCEYGTVDILCNNAGVGVGGTLDQMTIEDWQWVVGVNLYGVAHGLAAFLPRMRDQDGRTHVVNTASVTGILPSPFQGIYSATKSAVIAISEVLRMELAPHDVGVTVVCPGVVRTRIWDSRRNRPASLATTGDVPAPPELLEQLLTDPVEPQDLGRRVLQAVRNNELYVFPHNEPYFADLHGGRSEAIAAALARK